MEDRRGSDLTSHISWRSGTFLVTLCLPRLLSFLAGFRP